jgi:drug/metabolite transporter (DMT)-like permease
MSEAAPTENVSLGPTTLRSSRWLADLALLAIAAIWGAGFFMVKDATSTFPVMSFLAIRFGFGTLALLPFVLRIGRWPTPHEWRWGLIAGFLFFSGYLFQTFSLRLEDSGRTGFITGLYVILVPILALILLRHRLSFRAISGALLAVIGMWLLSNAPGGNFLGDFLACLCALTFAGQILAVEKFPVHSNWLIMAIMQSACVALFSMLFVPIQAVIHTCTGPLCESLRPFGDAIPRSVPLAMVFVAAFLGVVATAGGLLIQVWAQRKIPPSDTAVILAMESPFAALFGWIFLGEIITSIGLLGCGLILIGMLITALVPQEKLRPDVD